MRGFGFLVNGLGWAENQFFLQDDGILALGKRWGVGIIPKWDGK